MGIRVGVQVSKRGLYTHIHLDYTRVEFLSYIIKKKYVNCEVININKNYKIVPFYVFSFTFYQSQLAM